MTPPSTSANSNVFIQSAYDGSTAQNTQFQTYTGLAPYLLIQTPAKTTGTATNTLKLNPDTSTFYSEVIMDSNLIIKDTLRLELNIEDTSPDSVLTIDGDTVKMTATIGMTDITGNIGNSTTGIDTLFAGYVSITVVNTGDIVAGTGITTAMISRDSRYNGSSAIDITADPQIADGFDGQVIKITGLSDTNTLTLDDATGLQLSGGVSFVLGVGDVIQLHYVSSLDLWVEDFRSDN